MKSHCIYILILLIGSEIKGQQLSKNDADSVIYAHFPRYQPDTVLYLINGVPFDRNKIDSILNSHKTVTWLSVIPKEKLTSIYKDIILFLAPYQQKKKTIREQLVTAQHLFLPPGRTSPIPSPELFINGERIDQSEARRAVDKLKVRKIFYIDYEKPDSGNLLSVAFKHGVVRIFTK